MSVTLSLFAGAGAQFFDNNGNPLSGGKIYTYAAGTTTPNPTYTTNSDSSLHTNPIVLDAAGRVPSGGEIWLQLGVGYKFVVKTSAEVLIATYDNIPSSAQPPAANDADSIMYEQGYTVTAGSFVVGKIYRILTVGTTNFTLIGAVSNTIGTHFIATGVGTGTGTAQLSQTVETKLQEFISVKDFGAVGDGVTDDRPAVTLALAAIAAGDTLLFPPGNYNMKTPQTGDTAIVLPVGVNMIMEAGAWLISTQGIADPATGGSFISPLGNNSIVCNIDGGGYPPSGGVTGTWATWANAGIRGYVGTSTGLGAENVSIHGSEIKNVTYPVQIYGAKNWRVFDNRIHRYKQTGILAGFYASYDCKYNQISGNSFEDGGDYAVAFFQVGGQAAGVGAYNIVSNNIAKNMNQRTNGFAYGVEAGNPDNQYGFVFSGNIYETTVTTGAVTMGGITIATTSDSIVIGNKLRGSLGSSGDTGINAPMYSGQKARRGLIANNHIEGFRSSGINVDGHDEVTVRGNVIKNCGDTISNRPAILVALTNSSTGQVIENNTLIIESTYPYYGAGTPAIGCFVAAGKTVSNVTIRGNTIINPNDYGIQVSGLSGNLVRGVTIANNSIIGINDATFFARNPFHCKFLTEFSISGNTVINAKNGVVAQNSTFGTIGENEIRGSNTVTTVWDITNSTNLLLRNNEVSAPFTAILASAPALTTPANNNRAIGGSGLVVRNKGISGLIASGATISHGLSVPPTNVSVTPADTGVTDFYVTAIGGSTFQVVYGGGGTHAFYWIAEF